MTPNLLKATTLSRIGIRWLPLSLLFVVTSYYFWFLYQNALNIPWEDDIYDVLKVVSDVTQSEDWRTSLQLLFSQHNDHRTMSSRLIYYASYLIQGELSFRTLIFLANLSLPLILGMFFLRVRHLRYRWLLLLPSALLLFQLRSYQITLWSMAAFAYFYVFLYGFCCIYCLNSVNRYRFFLALVFAIFANFTLASGQVVWVVGLMSLLHQRYVLRRISLAYALCWIFVAILVLALWKTGLETPLTPQLILSHILDAPIHHIHYFFVLLGSSISGSSIAVATVTGCVLMLALVFSSIKSIQSEDIRLELCCWYIVLSVAAVVLGRAYFTEVQYALNSRYSFPSVLMLSAVWLLVAINLNLRRPAFLLSITLLAGVYSVNSYMMYSEALQPYVDLKVKRHNRSKHPAWTKPKGEASQIVAESVLLGIYKPPPRPMPRQQVILNIKNRGGED